MGNLPSHFWNKVVRDPDIECWLWIGASDQKGYGIWGCQKERRAHRVSYIAHKGPIPKGLEIDHLCAVKCCVNPDHLEAVTAKENTRRNQNHISIQRRNKTHCHRGHRLIGDNLYVTPDCRRMCRICQAKRNHMYQQKRKAQARIENAEH